MRIARPKLVSIYRAKNAFEAQVIRIALLEAGIQAQIDNEELQNVAGELPNSWAAAPQIQVDQSQADIAWNIINNVQKERERKINPDEPNPASQCLSCGNAMADEDVKCSACGWSFLNENP